MIHKLVFDATDSNTQLASSNVGAYLRASDGTLITHTGGALDVNIDNASLAVTATDLDIRNLVFATDKVDVSGSEVSLDSATLAALENITVSATDLDIRDLSHVSDSVKVGDGTDFLAVNTDGSINVNSIAASLASLSTIPETVGTSAAAIVDGGDELANRKKLFMYNNGNRQMYIGATGVTTSTGFPIPPGAILEIDSGAAMDVFAIADAAGQNMRTLQLA